MSFYAGSRLTGVADPPAAPTGLLNWGGVAKYTLEIIRPSASSNILDICRVAYPGLAYSTPIGAIGGVRPFLYELTANVPAGMVVGAFTGIITWPTPIAGTYSSITFRVTDSAGNTATGTYTLTCATTRFRFIDAVNGSNTNAGTSAAAPWQTLAKFQASGGASAIGIFRSGTYTVADCVITNGNSTRWGIIQGRPSMFVAHPSDTLGSVIFDHGYRAGIQEGIEFDYINSGASPYVCHIGIYHTLSHNKCLRVGSENDDLLFWKCRFTQFGPGQDQQNSAAVDFESGSYTSGYLDRGCAIDCEFDHYVAPASPQPNCCFKMYVTRKFLVLRNTFHDLDVDGEDEQAIAYKAGNERLTVAECTAVSNMDQGMFGGNQNAAINGSQCDVEFVFNHIKMTSGDTILMNHDHTSNAASYLYRNTFEGPVVWDELQAANGPYTFDRNVVINNNAATDTPDGSGITFNIPAVDITRLTATNTIFGNSSAGIVDSNGLLTATYEASRYYYGHQVPA